MKKATTGIASLLTALTMSAAVPAFAQSQPTDANTANTGTATTTTVERVEDNDRDYGWIGLLGLAGLLGLRRKPEVHRTTTTPAGANNR